MLEGAGYVVEVALDGQEALDAFGRGASFDLVISDVEMPRVGGVQLVEALRKTHSKERLPIVLVTSVAEDALRVEGMAAGANALILKQTFDPEHLLAVVSALLNSRTGAAE